MRTVAVANQKGGVGKTTTAVCLAGALAERGERVLVVDADAQGNATRWLGADSVGAELLEAWERGDVEGLIMPTTIESVELLPSSPMLAVAEKHFAAVLGSELLLRDALRALPKRWTWMLIDCPPTLGFVTTSALIAAKEILIPMQTELMALEGLRDLEATVAAIRKRGMNRQLKVRGIVGVMHDRRTRLSGQVLDALHTRYGDQMLKTTIRKAVRLAEAPGAHQPITIYEPDGMAAKDVRDLAEELAA